MDWGERGEEEEEGGRGRLKGGEESHALTVLSVVASGPGLC